MYFLKIKSNIEKIVGKQKICKPDSICENWNFFYFDHNEIISFGSGYGGIKKNLWN